MFLHIYMFSICTYSLLHLVQQPTNLTAALLTSLKVICSCKVSVLFLFCFVFFLEPFLLYLPYLTIVAYILPKTKLWRIRNKCD